MRWILAFLLVIVQTFGAAAQDDKDRITRFLEGALSDAGRDVEITGFRGALNSRATIDKLTIADDKGVWLTLTDAVLDWNRAAILSGRIEINELSAARIDLPRVPSSSDSSVSPEAGTFALPELPVSVRIDEISVKEVVLGQPVLGLPVKLSVTGSASLADGEGAAMLGIDRLEGPRGAFRLDAGFVNETRVLAIDLSLDEAADGLVANLLHLPDTPALELSVTGNSVIDDFTAQVALTSDGQQRLTGHIETQADTEPQQDGTQADVPNRVIQADLAGDLTPLFAPQYRAFFGHDVGLEGRISLFDDGRTWLDTLTITSAELQVTGDMKLSSDGLPEQFQLDIALQNSGGELVLLPLAGSETRLQSAMISSSFDSSLGDAWTMTGDLLGLQRADMAMGALNFTAGGMIQRGETRRSLPALMEQRMT